MLKSSAKLQEVQRMINPSQIGQTSKTYGRRCVQASSKDYASPSLIENKGQNKNRATSPEAPPQSTKTEWRRAAPCAMHMPLGLEHCY
eukprot:1147546-Pelagomonas_calceolata.AAC.8